MGKKKPSGGLAEGTRVRVRDGVTAPEFPDVSLSGWTGTIAETSGKSPNVKYIVEWDDATIERMPKDYLSRCEAQNLYHRMACLPADELEIAE